MKAFEFVSHEAFPDDQYIAEAVVLSVDGKHRVTYLRKRMKNGGLFWDVVTVAVRSGGEKKYLKAFATDSNFLREDISSFLEGRSWERGAVPAANDEVPF